MVLDFIYAALPWVIMGICVAVWATKQNQGDCDEKATYLNAGMMFGMSLGIIITRALRGNLALGISLGMLVGETVGMCIKRKTVDSNKKE